MSIRMATAINQSITYDYMITKLDLELTKDLLASKISGLRGTDLIWVTYRSAVREGNSYTLLPEVNKFIA